MLHILLVILKIIGILLAAILGLLVLGVLLVLFVPLRYQLDFERGTERSIVLGRFGWLARLILVTARLEGGKPHITVRICGITKQLLPAAKKGQAEGSGTPTQSEPEHFSEGETVHPSKKEPGHFPEIEEKRPAQEEPEQPSKEEAEEYKEFEESGPPEEDSSAISDKKKSSSEKAGISDKIKGLYTRIKSTLLKIYGILIHIPEIPRRLLKKWRGVQNKADAVKKKAAHYIELWKDEGTQAVFMLSKDQIRFLWKHLHPRKIQGKLRFGFEDPSITGIVAGGLYVILPMSFYELELLPEFEPEKPLILEGKLLIKGHVRLCHLAKSGWILFRNRELRQLLKQLKT